MKVPAFTIVESMMALIVIMISFVAGMTVYLTILQGDAFPMRLRAQNALKNVYVQTKEEQRFIDENLQEAGFVIEKKVVEYKAFQKLLGQEQVYQVSLKAYTPTEELILEQEHLIRIINEN